MSELQKIAEVNGKKYSITNKKLYYYDINLEGFNEIEIQFKNCILKDCRLRNGTAVVKIISNNTINSINFENGSFQIEITGSFEVLQLNNCKATLDMDSACIKYLQIHKTEISLFTARGIVENLRLIDSVLNRLLLQVNKLSEIEFYPKSIKASNCIQNNELNSQYYETIKTCIEICRVLQQRYEKNDKDQWYYFFMLQKILMNYKIPGRKRAINIFLKENVKEYGLKLSFYKRKRVAAKNSIYQKSILFEKIGHYFVNPDLILFDIIKVILFFSAVYLFVGLERDNQLEFSLKLIISNFTVKYALISIYKSIYFSFTTFSTVGYGDYRIRDLFEVIPIIEMLLGVFSET